MAKDPAFLFYSNDFLSGTFTMSNEQVGKYIRLLCLQHQKGKLTKNDMLNICKTYDEDIFSKFKVDKDNNYYNLRLKEEFERRKAYSESRRKNRKKPKVSKTYDKHMETETEAKTKERNFKKPTKKQVESYFKEIGFNHSPNSFIDFYESKGWMIGKNKMKDWKAAARHWKSREPKEYGKSDKAFTELEKAMNQIETMKNSYPEMSITEIVSGMHIKESTRKELIKVYKGI